MDLLQEYVQQIVGKLDCSLADRRDYAEEFLDHLTLLKEEYLVAGFGESDSINMAIHSFGDAATIQSGLQTVVSPFQKRARAWFSLCFSLHTVVMVNLLLVNWSRSVVNSFLWGGFSAPRFQSISAFFEAPLPRIQIMPNLIPFKTISYWLGHLQYFTWNGVLPLVLGKVLIFLPLGLLLPIVCNRGKTLVDHLRIFGCIGGLVELMQYALRLGVGDIDDVFLYILGSLVGLGFYRGLTKIKYCMESRVECRP